MKVIHDPPKHKPDDWVYAAENHCHQCGAVWIIDRMDKRGSWLRVVTGSLRKPWWDWDTGLGPAMLTTMYIIKYYPAETGICGTFLISRCHHCGAQCFTRKPYTDEGEAQDG